MKIKFVQVVNLSLLKKNTPLSKHVMINTSFRIGQGALRGGSKKAVPIAKAPLSSVKGHRTLLHPKRSREKSAGKVAWFMVGK